MRVTAGIVWQQHLSGTEEREAMKPHQPTDSGWKDILDKYFPQFLEFFFPRIYKDIDFKRNYTFLDKEFQKIVKESKIGRRYADKLVKVYLKDGSEEWLLIHIEVQSENEERFEERLYIYNYRIFDRYKKEVVTLVVLADSSESFRPKKYETERWGFRHTFVFPSLKLLDFKNQEQSLEESNNPFATVTLAHLKLIEARDNTARKIWKISLVKSLHKKGFSKADILNLYFFIDWLIALPPEMEREFHDEITEFEEELKMPYISTAERIGREKGKREEKNETAKKMKEKGFEIKTIAEITGLSEEDIKKL